MPVVKILLSNKSHLLDKQYPQKAIAIIISLKDG